MIHEIEFEKASLSVTAFAFSPATTIPVLADMMIMEDRADLKTRKSGFADVETFGGILRGSFLLVTEEAVEVLREGMIVAETVYQVSICNFIMGDGGMYVWGDGSARKSMNLRLTVLDGNAPTPIDFKSEDLVRFQHRLNVVSSISVRNPKSKEIRKIRMVGKVEDYSSCNVLDPCNHEIESVAGTIEHQKLGVVKVTIGRKGTIKVGMKPGAIIETDFLGWIVGLIRDGSAPAVASPLDKAVQKMLNVPGARVGSVSINGEEVYRDEKARAAG